jgi:hypothetical protein
MPRTSARFLRQGVTLTGVGSKGFSENVEVLKFIDERFERKIGTDVYTPWVKDTYLGWDAFSVTNRYFTNARRQSYLEAIPFDRLEDPNGVLDGLASSTLVHCEDNKVGYFKRVGVKK